MQGFKILMKNVNHLITLRGNNCAYWGEIYNLKKIQVKTLSFKLFLKIIKICQEIQEAIKSNLKNDDYQSFYHLRKVIKELKEQLLTNKTISGHLGLSTNKYKFSLKQFRING
ncbi:unnamed protein product (macronuclear) [Paramecium tetraurelia]|uniref:DNA binding HTH domain-containing protein n=1 Tax=Paramecium tetraurelia TaxID=5888 RepID=A0D832_PARTE|nr:uncharacterized protein GSPATT00014166001 [Paramecium tetraurelia]CAK79199.1 unnamed protein product [Paramecium tetraurelia]|eukprot:XP_001446596.1 hypothetical protein (macronuclear) [Paramecium tetraurelia strain d4-2]